MKKNIIKNYLPILLLSFTSNLNPLDKAIGFQNPGAMCFMNATLQCLLGMDKFNDLLSKNKDRYIEDSLSKKYIDLFEEYKKFEGNKAYNPSVFSEKMWPIALPSQTKGNHQDADEFLKALLNRIIDQDISENNDDFKVQVAELVQEKFQSTSIKPAETNINTEPFTVIPLTISGNKLKYCLSNFFRIEKPEDFEGIKQYAILNLPTYLIIQINRFSKTFEEGELKTEKIGTNIEIDQTLDLQPYLAEKSKKLNPYYNLIGIVEHSGNLSSGHYIAYSKRENKWYKFNDSDVTELNQNKPPLQNIDGFTPYILFYEKETDEELKKKKENKIDNAKKFISKIPDKDKYKAQKYKLENLWYHKKLPINYVLEQGNFSVLQTILANPDSFTGHKINGYSINLDINAKNQLGEPALQNAIEKGNLNEQNVLQTIKYFISR